MRCEPGRGTRRVSAARQARRVAGAGPWGRGAALALALVLALVLAGWLAAAGALAQDCPPPEGGLTPKVPTLARATNPHPSDLDLVLPLPGGGRMVFRHVCVPASGLLGDLRLDLGCTDCGRRDLAFMEARRRVYLAGSFRLADLPPAWRDKLTACARQGDGRCPDPADRTAQGFYYFIGKYEVSRQQWQAVQRWRQGRDAAPAAASAAAPAPAPALGPDDARPITDISWFEAQEFAAAYTEWLLREPSHPLPSFGQGRTAFLRLPTEAEWEYAARGGQKLSELQFNQEDIFPLGDKPLAAYAVFSLRGAAKLPERPAWIGSRCPNPLGLYDTAGNVSEMVGDLFSFSVGQRAHGGAGGFVIKGGSFLKTQAEVLPGRREEMPFFLGQGPYRAADLGFRLVIAGILTPQDRDQELRSAWSKLGETGGDGGAEPGVLAREMDPTLDPLAQIDRLLKSSANPAEKKNLQYLRDVIKAKQSVIAEQRAESARGAIRTALFTAESVASYAVRRKWTELELQGFRQKCQADQNPATRQAAAQEMARVQEALERLANTINASLNFYMDRVKDSANYDPQEFQAQMMRISDELRGQDKVTRSFREHWEMLAKHIIQYRFNPASFTRAAVKQDLLPANLQ
ncbi:MAG: formylglycine-generating enzyme family protein [Deltaproteobacteria bacterium]|nr:formylglycine-generating enzyme family protein [Deltaproteobacteria bacterium]